MRYKRYYDTLHRFGRKKTGDGLPNLLLWFFVNTTNIHKRTTQETTSWYYLSIHFRPATESQCLCRKKAWRKSQAPCWSQDRAPGKHHEISWQTFMRCHEITRISAKTGRKYWYVPMCPNIFSITPNMFIMSLWWSLMCFGDLMVSPSSPSSPEFRVIPGRPWPGGSTPSA